MERTNKEVSELIGEPLGLFLAFEIRFNRQAHTPASLGEVLVPGVCWCVASARPTTAPQHHKRIINLSCK
eukprot:1195652-Prorocentrum_minimum.AAC.5